MSRIALCSEDYHIMCSVRRIRLQPQLLVEENKVNDNTESKNIMDAKQCMLALVVCLADFGLPCSCPVSSSWCMGNLSIQMVSYIFVFSCLTDWKPTGNRTYTYMGIFCDHFNSNCLSKKKLECIYLQFPTVCLECGVGIKHRSLFKEKGDDFLGILMHVHKPCPIPPSCSFGGFWSIVIMTVALISIPFKLIS